MNHRSFLSRRRAAFTLTELLVVIVLITVLAGLLLPVVGAVNERGRATKCLSNMRQIGLGCISYAGDHNDTLPGPCSGGQAAWCRYYYDAAGNPDNAEGALTVRIAPYLGSTVTTVSTFQPIFMCPTFAKLSPAGNAGTSFIVNTLATQPDPGGRCNPSAITVPTRPPPA